MSSLLICYQGQGHMLHLSIVVIQSDIWTAEIDLYRYFLSMFFCVANIGLSIYRSVAIYIVLSKCECFSWFTV